MNLPAADYDIVLVGGGLTGLAFAGLVDEFVRSSDTPLRVALLEASPPEAVAEDAELDMRVSALAPASRAMLTRLQWWDALPANRVSAYQRMRVWHAAGQAGGALSINFDAAELGEADLGHIVENRAVRQVAWQALETGGNIELLTGREPVRLTASADNCTIEFAQGKALTTRLIVGADGARSWVRQQLRVASHEQSYGQAGVVAHIASERAHESTAWQRFLRDGPVALLPLADGRSSLVWSCPDEQAHSLKEMSEKDFAAQVEAALDGVLGRLECTTPRASFPLALATADKYTGPRFALLGDAAHRVHPLAGQGANLGLLDAASLAECLIAHLRLPFADPGDPLALRRYERARKGDNLATMQMMDLLNRVFASSFSELAGRGMEAVDHLPQLKTLLARYAMGYGRELPAAAQPLVS